MKEGGLSEGLRRQPPSLAAPVLDKKLRAGQDYQKNKIKTSKRAYLQNPDFCCYGDLQDDH